MGTVIVLSYTLNISTPELVTIPTNFVKLTVSETSSYCVYMDTIYIYISLYIFEYFQSTKNNTTWKGTVKTSEKKTTTLPKNKNNWLPNQRSLSILPVVVDSPCREWNKNCRKEKLGSKTHGISSSWWHWRSFPMSALQCQTPEKVRRSSNP